MKLKACHDGTRGSVTNCNNTERFDITGFELAKVLYTCGLFGKIELTAGSKLVLWALCSYYNPKKRTVYPAQATLARQLGISEKTVERAVKELKDNDLLLYETRKVNHYAFSAKFWFMTGVRPSLESPALSSLREFAQKDKMSEAHRQNVALAHRQNVGQTNNVEKNKKTFYSQKFYSAGEKAYNTEILRTVPSVEQTQTIFENLKEAKKAHKEAILPKDYSKKRAYEWIKGLDPRTRRALKSVRELCEKWGFDEFQDFQ